MVNKTKNIFEGEIFQVVISRVFKKKSKQTLFLFTEH